MATVVGPIGGLRFLDVIHVVLTLSLFVFNVLLTHLIGPSRFWTRLKYLGPEMVYLAAAIVASHVFTFQGWEAVVPIVAIFPYIGLWILALILTKESVAVGRDQLHSLTYINLLIGGVAVYCALAGAVEGGLTRLLPHGGA